MPNYVMEADQFFKFIQNLHGSFKSASRIHEIVSHSDFPEVEHFVECSLCGYTGYHNVSDAYRYVNNKYHLWFPCNCRDNQ